MTLDEFHWIVLALSELEDAAGAATQRLPESQRFWFALRRAVRPFIRPYLDLAPIRIRISV